MLVSDTGSLKRPVSMSEIQAPLAVAAARLRVHGALVEIAAANDLPSIVRLRSGRLPRSCDAAGCEMLQIGRGGLAHLAEDDVRLSRVGVAGLRDPRIFGDISAATAANG